ncbi:MAG: hypothetical protein ABSD52_03610 [Candidatus Cybelea sp.]|jgi:hypothetical protein
MAVSPMERQVLRLLHRARNPGALAAMSIPAGALEQIVKDALAGDDARTERLRRAILEADFKRTATNAELARQNGVSLRHFQRWRAEAVASIARHAAGPLGSIQAPRAPRSGACWRFRREVAAFLAARDRGNALEMRCIATNLIRLARDTETQTLAEAYLGDANQRLGITEDRLAPDLAVRGVRGSRCWRRIAREVERARRLVLQGGIAPAQALASPAWQRCELRGFQGLAAGCAAVLCATAEARAAFTEARLWRARAIERLLPTQDRLLAAGLFFHPAYGAGSRMDRALSEVVYERLCVIVPQMLGDGEPQRAAVMELLIELLDARVSPGAIASVARCDSAFAHYIEKNVEPVAEMLALALTALTVTTFDAAFDALRRALANCASKLRPAVPRTIAIAVPKSHSASIDHLKFDDQRSGRVEYPAGLHVRFLPFRSDTGAAHPRRRSDPAAGPPGAVAGPAHSR